MKDKEKLANFIDAILDQTTDNEIKISISQDKSGYTVIIITDNLSEICTAQKMFPDEAIADAFEQLEDFVDGLTGGE